MTGLEDVVRSAFAAHADDAPSGAGLLPGVRRRAVRQRRRVLAGAVGTAAVTAGVVAGLLAVVPVPDRLAAVVGGDRALCGSVGSLQSLDVVRTDDLPQNRFVFGVPERSRLTDPAQARAVGRALCGIRTHLPAGEMSCPADFGVSYRLSFSTPGDVYDVVLKTSGCTEIRGLEPRLFGADPVWAALGPMLGARPPYDVAFAGAPPPPTSSATVSATGTATRAAVSSAASASPG